MDEEIIEEAEQTSYNSMVHEKLDKMMVVVRPKGWITLFTSLSLIFLLILWAFLGGIPIQVRGLALSITEEGQYVVVAQTDGTVVEILASEGDYVKKGQTLVKIVNPQNSLEIEQQKEKITAQETSLKNLTATITEEGRARNESIRQKIESYEFSLANVESRLPYLEKDLEAKTRLQGQGIISLPEVERAKGALIQAKNEIETTKAAISALKADLIGEYRVSELRAKRGEIAASKNVLAQMIQRSHFLEIKTDREGLLVESVVANGNLVKAGQLVATIETPLKEGEKMEFFATISANYGSLVGVGLPVQIEVAGVDPKQFGYLLGYISYISAYPVSREEIISYVINPQMADFIRGGQEAVYGVVIKLLTDPTTTSGFKWTNMSGPPITIKTGMIAAVNIIVQERRPIYYILPEKITPYIQDIFSTNPAKNNSLDLKNQKPEEK